MICQSQHRQAKVKTTFQGQTQPFSIALTSKGQSDTERSLQPFKVINYLSVSSRYAKVVYDLQ